MAVHFNIRCKKFWQVSIKERDGLVGGKCVLSTLWVVSRGRNGLAVLYTTVCPIFIGKELPRQLSAIPGDTNLLQLQKRLCFSGVL